MAKRNSLIKPTILEKILEDNPQAESEHVNVFRHQRSSIREMSSENGEATAEQEKSITAEIEIGPLVPEAETPAARQLKFDSDFQGATNQVVK